MDGCYNPLGIVAVLYYISCIVRKYSIKFGNCINPTHAMLFAIAIEAVGGKEFSDDANSNSLWLISKCIHSSFCVYKPISNRLYIYFLFSDCFVRLFICHGHSLNFTITIIIIIIINSIAIN